MRCQILIPTLVYSIVLTLRALVASADLIFPTKEKYTLYQEIGIVLVLELLPLLTSVVIIVRVAIREQIESGQLLEGNRLSSEGGIEVLDSKFNESSAGSIKRATVSPF